MNALPKVATVHEKTVKKAAELAEQADAKVHRIRTGHQTRSTVHHLKIDHRVWSTALELAGGDAKRITVVHEGEVIVHNHPQKGNKHHAN